jgi:hypothetical protein
MTSRSGALSYRHLVAVETSDAVSLIRPKQCVRHDRAQRGVSIAAACVAVLVSLILLDRCK